MLALVGEGVGGHPGHPGGGHALLELEQLRPGPHLGAVGGDVDGQIPDDGDALPVGVGLHRRPLAEEEQLEEGVEIARLLQLRPGLFQGGLLPQPELVGPVGQRLSVESCLLYTSRCV